MNPTFHEEEIHRVLGTKFTPPFPKDTSYIILGPGCFWGGEKTFWRLPGVYTTASGFCRDRNSTNTRAYIEAVLVVFDPEKISLADILRMFLQCHDPTQVGGQGNDVGPQYRSAIFYNTNEQERLAKAAIKSYSTTIRKNIKTEVMQGYLDDFAYANDSHQQYLATPGARPYSSVRPLNIQFPSTTSWLPDDLVTKHQPLLKETFWRAHSPTFQSILHVSNDQVKIE